MALIDPIDVARPFPEAIIQRGLWRKIFRQQPALATRAIYIADGIEHLAHIRLALAPAWGEPAGSSAPCFLANITHLAVCAPCAVRPSTWQPPAFPASAAIDASTGDSYGSRISETRS